MSTFQSITPMFPTGPQTLAESLRFFTDEMGFAVHWQHGNMASIGQGQIRILLVENNNREWAENSSYSIGVSNLEELYEKYKSTSAQTGPLEMKFWGRREFHMILPSGVCLQFYQA